MTMLDASHISKQSEHDKKPTTSHGSMHYQFHVEVSGKR
jgi:hypothetical protein